MLHGQDSEDLQPEENEDDQDYDLGPRNESYDNSALYFLAQKMREEAKEKAQAEAEAEAARAELEKPAPYYPSSRMVNNVMGNGSGAHVLSFLSPQDAARMASVSKATHSQAARRARCQMSDCPSYGRLFVSPGCKSFCSDHLWSWLRSMIEQLLFGERSYDYMKNERASQELPIQVFLEIYTDDDKFDDVNAENLHFASKTEVVHPSNASDGSSANEWKGYYIENLNETGDTVTQGFGPSEWRNNFKHQIDIYRENLEIRRHANPDPSKLLVYLTCYNYPYSTEERNFLSTQGVEFFNNFPVENFDDNMQLPVLSGLLDEPRSLNKYMGSLVSLFTFHSVPDPTDDDEEEEEDKKAEEVDPPENQVEDTYVRNRYLINRARPHYPRIYRPGEIANFRTGVEGYLDKRATSNNTSEFYRRPFPENMGRDRDEDGQPHPKRQKRDADQASSSSSASASSATIRRNETGQANSKRQRTD